MDIFNNFIEDATSAGQRLVFVGGAPRSGTTLVQNMLDSHPDVYGGPEFDRIPNIVDLRRKLQNSVRTGRIDVFCTLAQVDAAMARMVESLLLPVADRNHCRLLSEKTPWNILCFPDLMEMFPSARFVHVIRDPRAVVLSMRQVARRARKRKVRCPDFTRDMLLAVQYIKTCYTIALSAYRMAPDRMITIKYEELLRHPEKIVRSMCAFLHIDFNAAMLCPADKNHDGEKNIMPIWYDIETYRSNPFQRSMDKWKTDLPQALQSFIGCAMQNDPAFTMQGYELSMDEISNNAKKAGSIFFEKYRNRFGSELAGLRVLG